MLDKIKYFVTLLKQTWFAAAKISSRFYKLVILLLKFCILILTDVFALLALQPLGNTEGRRNSPGTR
jgi:hypothetical protein